MTNDWTMTRNLTGLGMYLLAVSICSLVNYHRNQEALRFEILAHLDARFDMGELCPWEWIDSI